MINNGLPIYSIPERALPARPLPAPPAATPAAEWAGGRSPGVKYWEPSREWMDFKSKVLRERAVKDDEELIEMLAAVIKSGLI